MRACAGARVRGGELERGGAQRAAPAEPDGAGRAAHAGRLHHAALQAQPHRPVRTSSTGSSGFAARLG